MFGSTLLVLYYLLLECDRYNSCKLSSGILVGISTDDGLGEWDTPLKVAEGRRPKMHMRLYDVVPSYLVSRYLSPTLTHSPTVTISSVDVEGRGESYEQARPGVFSPRRPGRTEVVNWL